MHIFRFPALLGLLALSTCLPEKQDENDKIIACGTNLHTDDSTCKNGVSDPGEMCLELGGSLPLGTHMHRYENLTLADFNGDGHVDVRIGSDIYAGQGDGTVSETRMIPGGGTSARDCAPGDFNGDGITDLAFVNYDINVLNDPNLGEDRKDIWVWFGNPKLSPLEIAWYDDAPDYPVRVFTGDFNEDGLDDLVVLTRAYDYIDCDTLFLMPKDGGFVPGDARLYASSDSSDCGKLLVRDFNGDGHLDIDTDSTTLHMGNGKAEFKEKTSDPRPRVTATHGFDLNCDKLPDAVDQNPDAIDKDTGFVRVWQGVEDAQFALVNPTLSPDETLTLLAEVNGDAEPDVVLAGPSGLRIFFGDDEFTFSAPTALSPVPTYTEIRAADLNEDGVNDIVALGAVGADIFLSHP